MTFARKTFLAILVATMTVGTLVILTAYRHVSKQNKENFIAHYLSNAKILADTLTRLDLNTEEIMLNAAKVVRAKDSEKGVLTTSELRYLRDDLKVTHVFIIDANGNFIRSTNEDPKLIPNIYSFSPEYRKLISGDLAKVATPVIQPKPEPLPYKFVTIPSVDKTRMIEVGVRVDFIGKILLEATKSDSNILGMSLYSPDGTAFGYFDSKGAVFPKKPSKFSINFAEPIDNGSSFSFFSKVSSSHPKCSQCDIAGTSKGGEYYYILESKISKAELNKVMASTGWAFLFIGLGNIILSLLLSMWLSERLVRNIERAVSKVRKINESGQMSNRLNLSGNDEVAYLTTEFDKLLDKLESTQARIVEAERVEAKVQLAREVAHNIKSPALAIEAMLPLMLKLPENISKTLKSSAREIKSLADKLNKISMGMVVEDKRAKVSFCYLPSLLEELISQKQFEYSSRQGIKIIFESIGEFKGAFVNIDAVDFKAILSNLINNAVDSYGGIGGQIKVTFDNREADCVVSISDKGAGIPPEYLKSIGSERITFKGDYGRGLGLVHAFEVVKSWGGKISINSTLGSGTIIEIVMPKYIASVEVPKEKAL